MALPVLGLVMVVKNESEQLRRCLATVRPYIDYWTICDTGSTDDTPELAKQMLAETPGVLRRHKWRNFGHNLTLAHQAAKGRSRWLLWLHADMTVGSTEQSSPEDFVRWLGQQRKRLDALDVEVQDDIRTYRLPLIMRGDIDWRYVGATHEYLARADGREIVSRQLSGLFVYHHADGTSRPEKFERDLALLKSGLIRGDPRDTFYTAETYRYAGMDAKAIHIYQMRASLNGYEEERWYAEYQVAALTQNVERLLEVWRERPWRHEPLTAAARIIAAENPQANGDGLFLERPPR